MIIYKKGILYLLITFLLSTSVLAQMSTKDIDKLVEDALQSFHVAGAAVAIVKDGKVLLAKGYGVKSTQTHAKVTPHTNFAIASNSKAFTTAALSILVEDGKLAWTDKVRSIIPEFKMYNDYVTENFNIQDLLTHRSGLGLGAGDLMFFPDGTDFTIHDILTNFQYFKPQSPFRTQFDYDNVLYIVAGEIIKRVSGMSWEDFVERRIIQPLGMNNTATTLSRIKDKNNLAQPHATKGNIPVPIIGFEEMINGAAGGIVSNADDLCNWMLVQLNHGHYGKHLEKTLFTEQSQKEMWSLHTAIQPGRHNPRYNRHFSGYGLGWFLQDVNGYMQVSHTGGLAGMLSKTVLIPDLDFGIVVLTNTENGGAGVFQVVTRTIIDSYLGLDQYDWEKVFVDYFDGKTGEADSVVAQVWATVDHAKNDCISLQNYVGTYKDAWFGAVTVSMKDGQLWFQSARSPKLSGPMAYYQANTFAIRWTYPDLKADAFALFQLDENGRAVGIKMKGISPEIDFSYDFQDLDLKRVSE